MAIEIILHGVKMTVTKDQLFELAANGGITKDTPVNVSGKMVTAKQIKGLVFEEEKTVVPTTPSPLQPIVSSPASTSGLSREGCISVGRDLMILSVLSGFFLGFLLAYYDLWFLLQIVGTLEGIGFFVGFAIFAFGLTLTDDKPANTKKREMDDPKNDIQARMGIVVFFIWLAVCVLALIAYWVSNMWFV